MTESSDMMKLYSKRILSLAADIPYGDRLEGADGSARKRSPLCGSTVTVDLKLSDGLVSEYGQDVKACALGQASASVIGKNIVGRSAEEVQRGRDELSAMLTADGPIPSSPFDELETLLPAKDYKNRHASILLTFDAILSAFEDASQTA